MSGMEQRAGQTLANQGTQYDAIACTTAQQISVAYPALLQSFCRLNLEQSVVLAIPLHILLYSRV